MTRSRNFCKQTGIPAIIYERSPSGTPGRTTARLRNNSNNKELEVRAQDHAGGSREALSGLPCARRRGPPRPCPSAFGHSQRASQSFSESPSPPRDSGCGPDGQGLRATYRLFGHSIRPLPVSAADSSVDFGHFTLNDFVSSVTHWFSRAPPSALRVLLEIRVPGPWASPSSCVLSSGRQRGFHSGGPLTVPPQNCGSITHPQRRPRPNPPNP